MFLDLNNSHNTVAYLDNALVVPPQGDEGARAQPSGVFDQAGNFVEQSISWNTSTSRVNDAPPFPDASTIKELKGKYLFGGIFYAHFGHFIVDSLSRIWALDELDSSFDGIIFTPKSPRLNLNGISPCKELLTSLGIDISIEIAYAPTRVEELHVPAQGFGMYDLIEGSQSFRDFINRHAGKGIAAEGPERLYISRSKLGANRGSILGESRLEEYLAEEGYDIFHPQLASPSEQIAKYKAARFIIGTDCSPLHLLGYVGNSDQTAAILTRRSMEIGSYLVSQLRAFKNMKATEFNCLVNDWMPHPGRRPSRSSWGEVDYTALHAHLLAAGLISNPTPWPNLTFSERETELARLAETHKRPFTPFHPID